MSSAETFERCLSEPRRIAGQITVGIAGGSGSGKSTIAADLAARLPPLQVEVINLDGFFKPTDELPRYHSSHHGEQRPDWNQLESLRVDDMIAACSKPVQADVVLLDGHMLLCYAPMRALLDIALFVHMDLDRMIERRTARNLANRYGGSATEMAHYCRESVVPGFRRHIEPSQRWADAIVPNDDGDDVSREAILQKLGEALLRHASG